MITTDCASSDSKTRDGHRRPRHDCALLFFSTSFTDEQATQGHFPYVFFCCMALVGASLLPDSSSKASMIRAIPSTYSRSPKNPALQLLQKSSKSASTTPQRPIWNTFGTVAVRDFWENDCSSLHWPKLCRISKFLARSVFVGHAPARRAVAACEPCQGVAAGVTAAAAAATATARRRWWRGAGPRRPPGASRPPVGRVGAPPPRAQQPRPRSRAGAHARRRLVRGWRHGRPTDAPAPGGRLAAAGGAPAVAAHPPGTHGARRCRGGGGGGACAAACRPRACRRQCCCTRRRSSGCPRGVGVGQRSRLPPPSPHPQGSDRGGGGRCGGGGGGGCDVSGGTARGRGGVPTRALATAASAARSCRDAGVGRAAVDTAAPLPLPLRLPRAPRRARPSKVGSPWGRLRDRLRGGRGGDGRRRRRSCQPRSACCSRRFRCGGGGGGKERGGGGPDEARSAACAAHGDLVECVEPTVAHLDGIFGVVVCLLGCILRGACLALTFGMQRAEAVRCAPRLCDGVCKDTIGRCPHPAHAAARAAAFGPHRRGAARGRRPGGRRGGIDGRRGGGLWVGRFATTSCVERLLCTAGGR